MNRFQLYELAKPVLPWLNLGGERMLNDEKHTSLCGMVLYVHQNSDCSNCQFHTLATKHHCHLWLENASAQQLKADIILKHPELLI